MSWYQKGYGGMDKEKAAMEERKRGNVFRFNMKANENPKKIIFLDDEPFTFHEHSLIINGSFGNFYTCTKGIDPCYLCDRKYYAYYVGAFTILDLTPYPTRDGGTKAFTKKLLMAKFESLNKLRIEKDLAGTLRNKIWQVARSSSTAAAIGDVFSKLPDPIDTEAKYRGVKDANNVPIITPYNYEKLFAPKSRNEFESLFSSGAAIAEASTKKKTNITTPKTQTAGVVPETDELEY